MEKLEEKLKQLTTDLEVHKQNYFATLGAIELAKQLIEEQKKDVSSEKSN